LSSLPGGIVGLELSMLKRNT